MAVAPFESTLQSYYRSFYWVYYVRNEREIPDHLALNAYAGQVQLGARYEEIKEFLYEMTEKLAGKANTEKLAILDASRQKIYPIASYADQNDMEREMFNELIELFKNKDADAGFTAFIEWITEFWTPEQKGDKTIQQLTQMLNDAFNHMMDNIIIEKSANSKENSKKVTLGNGLRPTNMYAYMERMRGGIVGSGNYKQFYIIPLNVEGDRHIERLGMFGPNDPLITPFNDLLITLLPASASIATAETQFVGPSGPFMQPVRNSVYIQASKVDFANEIIQDIDYANRFLRGKGDLCLARPQFTLLITEPGRVRNMSGIVAYTVSRAPQTAAAWAANFKAVADSVSGKPNEEQMYLYQLQSSLFEMQSDLMRDDWWSKPVAHWLTMLKWEQISLVTAHLRAMAAAASLDKNLFKATALLQKYYPVLKSVTCSFQFVATPEEMHEPYGNSTLKIDETLPIVSQMMPLEHLNIASSALLRAMDLARRTYTPVESAEFVPIYTFNIPFFVFPNITELPPNDVKNQPLADSNLQYDQLAATMNSGPTLYKEDQSHNLRRFTTQPDFNQFLTWLSSGFWRLAVSERSGIEYRCVVFSHPRFMAAAFNRATVRPGEVIPFSVRLHAHGNRWELTPETPVHSHLTDLTTKLNSITTRAAADPNRAYANFAALVPRYALDLVDARNVVATIKPRRKGLFGQRRSTYRRNLQRKLATVRRTLKLNTSPNAAAIAGAGPMAPSLSKLLGDNIGHILDAKKSAKTTLQRVEKLKPLYPNIWPAENIQAAKATTKTRRRFFGLGKNVAYERGVRETLRSLQRRLQQS